MAMPAASVATAAARFVLRLGASLRLLPRDRSPSPAEADLRRGLAARDRVLGLLAQDLQGIGLAIAAGAGSPAAEARRLLALSDQVTEFLAAEAGPRGLKPERFALLPLLQDGVEATAAQIAPARRDWRLAPGFASVSLRADPRALRGALLPVLGRAARLTRDGDWIGLRPVTVPEGFAIVVEDEGAGLPAEDLEAGPDPSAVEAARTRGLGFGLATARALLEAHGGSLVIESLRGVGTRAWMTLPRRCLVQGGA